jgi:hypothetical protein
LADMTPSPRTFERFIDQTVVSDENHMVNESSQSGAGGETPSRHHADSRAEQSRAGWFRLFTAPCWKGECCCSLDMSLLDERLTPSSDGLQRILKSWLCQLSHASVSEVPIWGDFWTRNIGLKYFLPAQGPRESCVLHCPLALAAENVSSQGPKSQ